ncbi:MAG: hypothetical protein P4L81_04755 [Candidatus Pacebacteria bacterium]|nr:hypothetical protein [Candidatus Paceibacterota bacterium]
MRTALFLPAFVFVLMCNGGAFAAGRENDLSAAVQSGKIYALAPAGGVMSCIQQFWVRGSAPAAAEVTANDPIRCKIGGTTPYIPTRDVEVAPR